MRPHRQRTPIGRTTSTAIGIALPVIVLGLLACSVYARADADDKADTRVPFPADYRTWTHVKSFIIGPDSPIFAVSGGLHHFYANTAALEGYRTGTFPDGAVLVDEKLATEEKGGVIREGPRRSVNVMVKGRARYAATGGWGFETFKNDERSTGALTAEVRARCFECHSMRKDRDFVYSSVRP